ncbi:MAG: hypothetical protein U1E05_01605, partial [Patescibacteria group bacterium]|nr:hypothetical protein [Patescibacteria group bacterium]
QRGEYVLSDLYVARMRGKGADGRLTSELTATGQPPSFAAEPWEQGLDARISLTNAMWRQPE